METSPQKSCYDSVLLTGAGIESVSLLALAQQKRINLLSVFVRMSDTDVRHMRVAEKQAKLYDADFHVVDARPSFFGLLTSGLRVRENRGRYVPGYRQILLSLGMQITDYVGASTLVIGEHAEWPEGHPSQILFEKMVGGNTADGELNPLFWQRVVNMYNETYSTSIKLFIPFIHLTKDQVVKQAAADGVLLGMSVTCRRTPPTVPANTDLWHCGEPDCFFCVSRRTAFKDASVLDPTEYAK